MAMRLRINVTTQSTELPWDQVLRPGRGLVYHLLAEADPDLAGQLHDHGYGPHGMTPFGYGAPVFPHAKRRPGRYAIGGRGYIELGSPLPELVAHWKQALTGRTLVDWGGVALQVRALTAVKPPDMSAGRVEFRTVTPAVLKTLNPMPSPTRDIRSSYDILPYESGYLEALHRNLERKAKTLGLAPDFEIEKITWVGPKRGFSVQKGRRTGTTLGVALRGSPDLLSAIWSWGLGQANTAGFGWIKA